MQLRTATAAALLSAAAAASDDHPIGGVISLLEELKAKVVAEGQEEEVAHAKFSTWCSGSLRTLNAAVSRGKEKAESLGDALNSKTKEAQGLHDELFVLEEEIGKHQVSNTEAQHLRSEAAATYQQADQDYEETISALQEAIVLLEDAKKEIKGDSGKLLQRSLGNLLQLPLMMAQLSDAQRDQITGVAEVAAKAAPEPKKSNFKSQGVVDLLKTMKADMEEERVEATKAETNSANAYAMAKDARDHAIETAQGSKEEKETLLGDVQQDKEVASSSRDATKEDLEADTTALSDTKSMCNVKAAEWGERSELRAHEIEAVGMAIKILGEVSGIRTDAPENPTLPTAPESSLLSLSFLQSSTDPKARAVTLLRASAKQSQSKAMQHLADQVAAHAAGPFDDINQMIQKMIFRLMKEQIDEDNHKNWCDQEISKSNSSKLTKEEKVSSLRAKIDDAKAEVGQLTEEITAAAAFVNSITAHMEEATEMRTEGKRENKAAIKDAQSAQAAIAQAEAVLSEFYKKSGAIAKEPWEFLQISRDPAELPEEPSSWGASYTGVTDPNKAETGILSVLRAVAEDFSKMEADTQAQEIADQKFFDEDIQASSIEKARREKEAEMKGEEKKRTVDKVATWEKSEKHIGTEIGAVEQYLKDLEPACITGDSSYEERKAARTNEVEALKEAQVILKDAGKEKTEPSGENLVQKSLRVAPAFLARVHLK